MRSKETSVGNLAIVEIRRYIDPLRSQRHFNFIQTVNDTGTLEKAGAALSGKYQSTGDKQLVLDLSESGLSAIEAAHVLLGLRLRNWRYDIYRTKLKDEQKITLEGVTVVGAPEGIEGAWAHAAALAEGVEFTRELVTEPAKKDT